jgi:undecaprenyl-phosphate 4-deoxy-4-formamido-L-arabinose transferase
VNKPGLSIVIPVFNEEQNLDALVKRVLDACRRTGRHFEVILVDDGSSDASREMISRAADSSGGLVVGVLLNRNYGQHAAVLAGFEESRGDLVVTLDADLQNPPEEIPRVVAEAEKGFDVVGTVRVPRQDAIFRRLSSWLVNKTVQKTTGVRMHDYGCMLRGYSRHVVNAMLQCREHSTFIPILANSFAKSASEIEVRHERRPAGVSKYGVWKLVNLQFDLLTSMTTFPLRLLTIMGMLLSMAGMAFGLLLIVLRLMHGPAWAAQGVFTLFAVLFVFVGMQFFGMGLLGEYVGRIYHDVRDRPRAFVEKVVGRAAGAAKE